MHPTTCKLARWVGSSLRVKTSSYIPTQEMHDQASHGCQCICTREAFILTIYEPFYFVTVMALYLPLPIAIKVQLCRVNMDFLLSMNRHCPKGNDRCMQFHAYMG